MLMMLTLISLIMQVTLINNGGTSLFIDNGRYKAYNETIGSLFLYNKGIYIQRYFCTVSITHTYMYMKETTIQPTKCTTDPSHMSINLIQSHHFHDNQELVQHHECWEQKRVPRGLRFRATICNITMKKCGLPELAST